MKKKKFAPEQHLENTRKITDLILSLEEDFELPNGWKLRELILHLWSWDDQIINGCEAKLEGKCDEFKFDHQTREMKFDKWNDVILEENKDISLDEAKEMFKKSRERVLSLFYALINQPETIDDVKSFFRNENIVTLWMHDKDHLEKAGLEIDF
jgi:hypothetical protein